MKELIKRLEEAGEGSRELDCQIALATGEFFIKHVEYKGDLYCKREDDGSISEPGNAPDMLVPPYTTSLDAALTLIPEGWHYGLMSYAKHYHGPAAQVHRYGEGHEFCCHQGNARAPALALCIAALRAQEADDAD